MGLLTVSPSRGGYIKDRISSLPRYQFTFITMSKLDTFANLDQTSLRDIPMYKTLVERRNAVLPETKELVQG